MLRQDGRREAGGWSCWEKPLGDVAVGRSGRRRHLRAEEPFGSATDRCGKRPVLRICGQPCKQQPACASTRATVLLNSDDTFGKREAAGVVVESSTE